MSRRLEESAHTMICKYIRLKYPHVIFTSDGSGLRLPRGLAKRYAKQKSERGIPDILIFEPNQYHHGLMIEVKRIGTTVWLKDGTLSKNKHLREQAAVLDRLKNKGYAAVFCIGAAHGMEIVDNYMSNKH